jgi:DNA-3-methyladenine glycosylase
MRLQKDFFKKDVLDVAPLLLGKYIVRKFDNREIKKYKITDTEAYRGEEDLACHCSKGKTPRTSIMYEEGGKIYVYLIYGMYWMLNFVCYKEGVPQAVLIRGITNFDGPGKLGKELQLNKEFNGKEISNSEKIWIEDNNKTVKYTTKPRVGIDYAGEIWKNKLWRFVTL